MELNTTKVATGSRISPSSFIAKYSAVIGCFSGLSSQTVIKSILFAVVALLVLAYHSSTAEQEDISSLEYIKAPHVDDIYFLDFRVLSDNLRPKEKYRLAKVVDITGEVISLQYGDFFYVRQQGLKDSIRYGQLRYRKYFQPKRYDYPLTQLQNMWDSGAVFMVKRPVLGLLYGNYVSTQQQQVAATHYIPGKRKNASASAFLKSNHLEDNLAQAFSLFEQSAQLGFAPGQVNLALMYLNGQYVDKNLKQALFWFNQAALQSYKPAILKYGIVCQQVSDCHLADFYQTLLESGVNIKVREFTPELT